MKEFLQHKKERLEILNNLQKLDKDWEEFSETIKKSLQTINEGILKGVTAPSVFQSSYISNLEIRKSEYEQNKEELQKSLVEVDERLEKFYKSDKSYADLKRFDTITTADDFINTLLTIKKGYEGGKITDEQFIDVKNDTLKFVDKIVNNVLLKAKDNRTHYADLIILNEKNEILFVKRSNVAEFEPGKYALPGGHIEPAESSEYACRREVMEELNLDLKDYEFQHVGVYEDDDCVIHYYLTQIISTKFESIFTLDSEELVNFEWIHLKDLDEKDLILNLKENFRRVIHVPITILNNDTYPVL